MESFWNARTHGRPDGQTRVNYKVPIRLKSGDQKGKIKKILRVFDQKWAFSLKFEFSRKNRFRIGFSTIRPMILKFGQDVALRGKLELYFFSI